MNKSICQTFARQGSGKWKKIYIQPPIFLLLGEGVAKLNWILELITILLNFTQWEDISGPVKEPVNIFVCPCYSVAFSQFFCSQDPDYRKMAVVDIHAW